MFFYYVFYLVRQKEIRVRELLCYSYKKRRENIVMEDNKTTVTQTEEKTEEKVVEQTTEKTGKTYTQAEYNALDKKLKEKYEKKYEGIDCK